MGERRRERVSLDDAYLPLVELATYGGLSVRTLRTYLEHKTYPLPHYHIGGKLLVRKSEYDAWVARFRIGELLREPNEMDERVAEAVKSMRGGL